MNMKHFLCLLFCLSFLLFPVYAQESYETYSGDTFKTGDVLTLGDFYLSSTKYSHLKYAYTDTYGKVRYEAFNGKDLPFSKVTIREIIRPEDKNMFLNEAVVFALESEKAPDKKLFVEIDRAIEQGEIVVNMPEPVIKCEEMTLEQMFICCVRVNKLPIDDKVVLNYISVVNKELGQECRRDQFKFRKLKGEYQARLEKGMADFDFTKTYFIKVNNNHNGYDFDHKGYPLSYPTRSGSSPKQCIPFNGFNFMPVNPDQAFFIPVSMDDAEKYEKRSRGTGQNGYVSPLVYTVVYLQPLDKYMELPKGKYNVLNVENLYRSTLIGVKVKGLEVYDNKNFRYHLIGSALFE